jgi:hypothetical protein
MDIRRTALSAVVMTALLSVAPPAARADTGVQIGNLEKKTLKFSLRCAGDNSWHTFSLNSIEYKWFDAPDWNGSCNSGSFELRIGTTEADGSVTEKVVPLRNGESYALVKPGGTNDYTAYDIRSMVVIANKSDRQLALTWGCSGVTPRTLRVSPNDFSWIHFGTPPQCSPYMASIDTTANDGSKTTIARPLVGQNLYVLSWNSGRQAWDIQTVRQGGGAAAANDAN